MEYEYLKKNLDGVRERMDRASAQAGRDPADTTLLAAVKYATAEEINELQRLGVTDIGENRVQQLLEHYEKLTDPSHLNIHFIGQLQTNKVKYIADKVCMIHSLDSLELAKEINKQAGKAGKVMNVLAEINSGREESKGGVLPEEAADLCLALRDFPNLSLRGFMTMAPKSDSPDSYLKYFGETYKLSLDIWYEKLHNNIKPIISMGMSGSFETAIRCGSTLVRIGHNLFDKS